MDIAFDLSDVNTEGLQVTGYATVRVSDCVDVEAVHIEEVVLWVADIGLAVNEHEQFGWPRELKSEVLERLESDKSWCERAAREWRENVAELRRTARQQAADEFTLTLKDICLSPWRNA